MRTRNSIFVKNGTSYLLSFLLVTTCFALWGFANDITNPMVKAFSKIFRMDVSGGTWVQVAFYGGYFLMALPAAMFIRKFSFKAGVLVGLALYAVGAFLFFPAKALGEFGFFLVAYLVMTCGLSFLETSCNPYILSMGEASSATRRLNFAQCFNPLGSIMGMFCAMAFIQARLDPSDTAQRALMDEATFNAVKEHDLQILISPYMAVGVVITILFLIIFFAKMPRMSDTSGSIDFVPTIKRLLRRKRYWTGVIAQFFYVGVQIMCWTYIIQYGTRIFTTQGAPVFLCDMFNALNNALQLSDHTLAGGLLAERDAEVLSQFCNIIAMVLFISSRFLATWLMKYIRPSRLLVAFALLGALLTVGVIELTGIEGLYCLVLVSGCMSLMFPTIYGIALEGMGEDAKFGAAGLIMAILGGAVLPMLQAQIIDLKQVIDWPAENASFVLPLICFLVVAAYGWSALRTSRTQQ
ncbi:MAG: L-fucose:H+ symporter permease [Alloprevotella sp.]|nr:L-fucose:H+ symporter permease [Alloprevotella sp.]